MPKKKNTEIPAAPAAAEQETEVTKPAEPMVTIIKTADAAKLSPRGGGLLTYQVSRMDDTVLLRIHKNDSSGRFSAEWIGVDAIRKSLAQLPKGTTSFKGAVALKSAWKGQSSCNSGFGAAILRAEGVFVGDEDPKKKGMLKLATSDALDAWEKKVLALPVPKDAEQVLLNPPKAQPFFKKKDAPTGHEHPVEDTTTPADAEVEATLDAEAADVPADEGEADA